MKKNIVILIICLSTFCLKAQRSIYGPYGGLVEDQQKEVLEKTNIKKVSVRFYDLLESKNTNKPVSDESIVFNSFGDPIEFTKKDRSEINTWKLNYDDSRKLKSKKFKQKRGVFKKYSFALFSIGVFSPKKVYYSYDNQNRLMNKKSYTTNNKFENERIRYFDNKINRHYTNEKGEVVKTITTERKDSLTVELEFDKDNKLLLKTNIFYNKDSLMLKKELIVRDTLMYKDENIIENNRIIKTRNTVFRVNEKFDKINSFVTGKYFIYNSDSSIKTIIFYDEKLRRYEYQYDKKGLLAVLDTYVDNEFKSSRIYKYEFY